MKEMKQSCKMQTSSIDVMEDEKPFAPTFQDTTQMMMYSCQCYDNVSNNSLSDDGDAEHVDDSKNANENEHTVSDITVTFDDCSHDGDGESNDTDDEKGDDTYCHSELKARYDENSCGSEEYGEASASAFWSEDVTDEAAEGKCKAYNHNNFDSDSSSYLIPNFVSDENVVPIRSRSASSLGSASSPVSTYNEDSNNIFAEPEEYFLHFVTSHGKKVPEMTSDEPLASKIVSFTTSHCRQLVESFKMRIFPNKNDDNLGTSYAGNGGNCARRSSSSTDALYSSEKCYVPNVSGSDTDVSAGRKTKRQGGLLTNIMTLFSKPATVLDQNNQTSKSKLMSDDCKTKVFPQEENTLIQNSFSQSTANSGERDADSSADISTEKARDDSKAAGDVEEHKFSFGKLKQNHKNEHKKTLNFKFGKPVRSFPPTIKDDTILTNKYRECEDVDLHAVSVTSLGATSLQDIKQQSELPTTHADLQQEIMYNVKNNTPHDMEDPGNVSDILDEAASVDTESNQMPQYKISELSNNAQSRTVDQDEVQGRGKCADLVADYNVIDEVINKEAEGNMASLIQSPLGPLLQSFSEKCTISLQKEQALNNKIPQQSGKKRSLSSYAQNGDKLRNKINKTKHQSDSSKTLVKCEEKPNVPGKFKTVSVLTVLGSKRVSKLPEKVSPDLQEQQLYIIKSERPKRTDGGQCRETELKVKKSRLTSDIGAVNKMTSDNFLAFVKDPISTISYSVTTDDYFNSRHYPRHENRSPGAKTPSPNSSHSTKDIYFTNRRASPTESTTDSKSSEHNVSSSVRHSRKTSRCSGPQRNEKVKYTEELYGYNQKKKSDDTKVSSSAGSLDSNADVTSPNSEQFYESSPNSGKSHNIFYQSNRSSSLKDLSGRTITLKATANNVSTLLFMHPELTAGAEKPKLVLIKNAIFKDKTPENSSQSHKARSDTETIQLIESCIINDHQNENDNVVTTNRTRNNISPDREDNSQRTTTEGDEPLLVQKRTIDKIIKDSLLSGVTVGVNLFPELVEYENQHFMNDISSCHEHIKDFQRSKDELLVQRNNEGALRIVHRLDTRKKAEQGVENGSKIQTGNEKNKKTENVYNFNNENCNTIDQSESCRSYCQRNAALLKMHTNDSRSVKVVTTQEFCRNKRETGNLLQDVAEMIHEHRKQHLQRNNEIENNENKVYIVERCQRFSNNEAKHQKADQKTIRDEHNIKGIAGCIEDLPSKNEDKHKLEYIYIQANEGTNGGVNAHKNYLPASDNRRQNPGGQLLNANNDFSLTKHEGNSISKIDSSTDNEADVMSRKNTSHVNKNRSIKLHSPKLQEIKTGKNDIESQSEKIVESADYTCKSFPCAHEAGCTLSKQRNENCTAKGSVDYSHVAEGEENKCKYIGEKSIDLIEVYDGCSHEKHNVPANSIRKRNVDASEASHQLNIIKEDIFANSKSLRSDSSNLWLQNSELLDVLCAETRKNSDSNTIDVRSFLTEPNPVKIVKCVFSNITNVDEFCCYEQDGQTNSKISGSNDEESSYENKGYQKDQTSGTRNPSKLQAILKSVGTQYADPATNSTACAGGSNELNTAVTRNERSSYSSSSDDVSIRETSKEQSAMSSASHQNRTGELTCNKTLPTALKSNRNQNVTDSFAKLEINRPKKCVTFQEKEGSWETERQKDHQENNKNEGTDSDSENANQAEERNLVVRRDCQGNVKSTDLVQKSCNNNEKTRRQSISEKRDFYNTERYERSPKSNLNHGENAEEERLGIDASSHRQRVNKSDSLAPDEFKEDTSTSPLPETTSYRQSPVNSASKVIDKNKLTKFQQPPYKESKYRKDISRKISENDNEKMNNSYPSKMINAFDKYTKDGVGIETYPHQIPFTMEEYITNPTARLNSNEKSLNYIPKYVRTVNSPEFSYRSASKTNLDHQVVNTSVPGEPNRKTPILRSDAGLGMTHHVSERKNNVGMANNQRQLTKNVDGSRNTSPYTGRSEVNSVARTWKADTPGAHTKDDAIKKRCASPLAVSPIGSPETIKRTSVSPFHKATAGNREVKASRSISYDDVYGHTHPQDIKRAANNQSPVRQRADYFDTHLYPRSQYHRKYQEDDDKESLYRGYANRAVRQLSNNTSCYGNPRDNDDMFRQDQYLCEGYFIPESDDAQQNVGHVKPGKVIKPDHVTERFSPELMRSSSRPSYNFHERHQTNDRHLTQNMPSKQRYYGRNVTNAETTKSGDRHSYARNPPDMAFEMSYSVNNQQNMGERFESCWDKRMMSRRDELEKQHPQYQRGSHSKGQEVNTSRSGNVVGRTSLSSNKIPGQSNRSKTVQELTEVKVHTEDFAAQTEEPVRRHSKSVLEYSRDNPPVFSKRDLFGISNKNIIPSKENSHVLFSERFGKESWKEMGEISSLGPFSKLINSFSLEKRIRIEHVKGRMDSTSSNGQKQHFLDKAGSGEGIIPASEQGTLNKGSYNEAGKSQLRNKPRKTHSPKMSIAGARELQSDYTYNTNSNAVSHGRETVNKIKKAQLQDEMVNLSNEVTEKIKTRAMKKTGNRILFPVISMPLASKATEFAWKATNASLSAAELPAKPAFEPDSSTSCRVMAKVNSLEKRHSETFWLATEWKAALLTIILVLYLSTVCSSCVTQYPPFQFSSAGESVYKYCFIQPGIETLVYKSSLSKSVPFFEEVGSFRSRNISKEAHLGISLQCLPDHYSVHQQLFFVLI